MITLVHSKSYQKIFEKTSFVVERTIFRTSLRLFNPRSTHQQCWFPLLNQQEEPNYLCPRSPQRQTEKDHRRQNVAPHYFPNVNGKPPWNGRNGQNSSPTPRRDARTARRIQIQRHRWITERRYWLSIFNKCQNQTIPFWCMNTILKCRWKKRTSQRTGHNLPFWY